MIKLNDKWTKIFGSDTLSESKLIESFNNRSDIYIDDMPEETNVIILFDWYKGTDNVCKDTYNFLMYLESVKDDDPCFINRFNKSWFQDIILTWLFGVKVEKCFDLNSPLRYEVIKRGTVIYDIREDGIYIIPHIENFNGHYLYCGNDYKIDLTSMSLYYGTINGWYEINDLSFIPHETCISDVEVDTYLNSNYQISQINSGSINIDVYNNINLFKIRHNINKLLRVEFRKKYLNVLLNDSVIVLNNPFNTKKLSCFSPFGFHFNFGGRITCICFDVDLNSRLSYSIVYTDSYKYESISLIFHTRWYEGSKRLFYL